MSDRDIINRLALEDRGSRYMVEQVAPLVSRLTEGKNFVNAQQFADLAQWFADDLEDSDETMERGKFEVFGAIEVIRVKPVTAMTVAEVAKKTGMPWSTVKDLITESRLVPEVRGRRKYYNISDLAPLLKQITERREE